MSKQSYARNIVTPSSTSFPLSPVAGELCYRTDLNTLFWYDGTSWRSSAGAVQSSTASVENRYTGTSQTITATTSGTAHDLTGASYTVPADGDYIVEGSFDFEFVAGAAAGAYTEGYGILNVGGVVQTGYAIGRTAPKNAGVFRGVVNQKWKVNRVTAGTVIKLQCFKGDSEATSTTAVCYGTTGLSNTKLVVQKDTMGASPQGPGCRVYHNASQNVSNATTTALAFNSERKDLSGMHDTSTNNSRVNIPLSGWYSVWAGIQWSSSTAGTIRQMAIRRNGTTEVAINRQNPDSSAGIVRIMDVSGQVYLSAGDYLEVTVYQDSGGTRTIDVGGEYSPEFSVQYIGSDDPRMAMSSGSFSAYRNAALSLSNGGVVAFDTEEWDISGWFDVTTNVGRFTPQVAGIYRLSTHVSTNVALTSSQYLQVILRKNGSNHRELDFENGGGSNSERNGGSTLVQANGSTDYFDVTIGHNTGGTVALLTGYFQTIFQGELVAKTS